MKNNSCELIFNAIKSRNGNLAEKLTVEHIINAKNNILNSIVSED